MEEIIDELEIEFSTCCAITSDRGYVEQQIEKLKQMDGKEEMLKLIDNIEFEVTACCNTVCDRDYTIEQIDKLKELINGRR